MKPYSDELVDDVEGLLEQVVLEEVSCEIWKAFEAALSNLDPRSRTLLETHLTGKTALELSRETQVSVKDIEKWLSQVKKEVQQNIRKNFPVRH